MLHSYETPNTQWWVYYNEQFVCTRRHIRLWTEAASAMHSSLCCQAVILKPGLSSPLVHLVWEQWCWESCRRPGFCLHGWGEAGLPLAPAMCLHAKVIGSLGTGKGSVCLRVCMCGRTPTTTTHTNSNPTFCFLPMDHMCYLSLWGKTRSALLSPKLKK